MGVSSKLAAEARGKLPGAQGNKCAICGEPLGARKKRSGGRGWNLDHVWPRGRYAFVQRGNLLASHIDCNHEKGSRDPTGCEVIMLMAVNARLGWSLRPSPPEVVQASPGREERRAAHEARVEADRARKAQRRAEHEARVAEARERRRQTEPRPAVLRQLDDLADTMRGLYGQ